MEFNIGMEENIAVLDLVGDLVAGTGEELEKHVAELIDKKCVNIIFQMNKINFMDSSGLKYCYKISRALSEKNGTLVFVQPNKAVGKVFHITGADRKLNLASSKADGLKLVRENINKAIQQGGT